MTQGTPDKVNMAAATGVAKSLRIGKGVPLGRKSLGGAHRSSEGGLLGEDEPARVCIGRTTFPISHGSNNGIVGSGIDLMHAGRRSNGCGWSMLSDYAGEVEYNGG